MCGVEAVVGDGHRVGERLARPHRIGSVGDRRRKICRGRVRSGRDLEVGVVPGPAVVGGHPRTARSDVLATESPAAGQSDVQP